METQQSITGISVVIPNYNGSNLLPKIIPPCIRALQNTKLPYEIIVADDCSTDNSTEILQKEFPQIIISTAAVNSGFSVTANRGISSATYNWVLLLNSDVILEPDYFQPLLKYTTQEKLFAVMGRIIGWDDDIIQDGAKYPVKHGSKIKTSQNYILADEQLMRNGVLTMYVSGANAFINKTVFSLIGGFNELFSPYYIEDTELSIRGWRLGYSSVYEHFAVCRHKTSSTISTAGRKKTVDIIYRRNKMFLHSIHLDGITRTGWAVQQVFEMLGQLLLLRSSLLAAFIQFIKKYPAVKQSRDNMKRISAGNELLSVKFVFKKIRGSIKTQKKLFRY
ncbi:MAG: glycosyltransferase family 2 protein [Chitinophagaceae bacterium]|nr:glycosyltransferase family 2 protein [Chitinophagaceae bacterium]